MALLRQHLAKRPAHELRGTATRLGVSHRGDRLSQEWIDAIAEAWNRPENARAILSALSPQAKHALCRLAKMDSVPATLFFAEYGTIRRPRIDEYVVPPWKKPQGAAEDLYYLGLLDSTDLGTIAITRARSLCLPSDLCVLVTQTLCIENRSDQQLDVPFGEDPLRGWALCHDVGQLLLLPTQEGKNGQTLALHHGRWLNRHTLRKLNLRLAYEEDPAPSSHRRSCRLRLLMLLAVSAKFLHSGQTTVLGRAWLSEPFADQLVWLWRAWVTCSPELRSRYYLADALLPTPWPMPLLEILHEMDEPFTAAELLALILSKSDDAFTYWSVHVDDLSSLEALLVSVLHELAESFGLVVCRRAGSSSTADRYQVTSLGAWLLGRSNASAPERPMPELEPSLGEFDEDNDRYVTTCPATTALHTQYIVSQFGCYGERSGEGSRLGHRYYLDQQSMAQASLRGQSLPVLQEVLASLGVILTPEEEERLQGWQHSVDDLSLTYRAVLHTASPAIMATLLGKREIYERIDEVVGPRTALVRGTAAEMRQILQEDGKQPWYDMASKEGSISIQSIAGLWLATKMYRLLSQHLPLGYAVAQETLDGLTSRLSTEELALLESEWSVLRDQVLQVMDGQTYVPAPFETDKEQWRELIAQAIDQKRSLSMHYFSAGRGLLTARIVNPYWIEERGGRAYLRGECDPGGDVRLFRLDRIQSLTFHSADPQSDLFKTDGNG